MEHLSSQSMDTADNPRCVDSPYLLPRMNPGSFVLGSPIACLVAKVLSSDWAQSAACLCCILLLAWLEKVLQSHFGCWPLFTLATHISNISYVCVLCCETCFLATWNSARCGPQILSTIQPWRWYLSINAPSARCWIASTNQMKPQTHGNSFFMFLPCWSMPFIHVGSQFTSDFEPRMLRHVPLA